MSARTLAIGCGAGFAGDRTDAALPVVETLIARGGPGVLMFETLAERTLALAHMERARDSQRGYCPRMEAFLGPVLRRCLDHGIAIVANFGAANPLAAARRVRRMAPDARVAAVLGDEVDAAEFGAAVVANAYLGAESIAAALRAGAQVVITGRVADPSLAVGAALAHFGWGETDWDRLARATIAGHLLECGAQVTGGYFSDPGCKDVPDLANLGFPIVEMDESGTFGPEAIEHLTRIGEMASLAMDNAQLFAMAQKEIDERAEVEEELRRARDELEARVAERTSELKESEEKYRSTLENIEEGVYELDLAGRFTFLNDAPPARMFWARRQLHETEMHRVDAESAAGAFTPFEPASAEDGVDEMLTGFAPRKHTPLHADGAHTLGIELTDSPRRWRMTISEEPPRTDRLAAGDDSLAGADCTVSGTAADMYRALWNRVDGNVLAVRGDRSVLDLFRSSVKIRWS